MMNDRMNSTLAELARECGVSVSHFTRAFRHSTGVSPHQWLLAQRISKARSLIAGATLNMSEIALECGFSSQSHLSAAFTASLGISPREYRRSFAVRKDRAASKRRSE
jgi:transcriptional regulator GlxA family with amidase domain